MKILKIFTLFIIILSMTLIAFGEDIYKAIENGNIKEVKSLIEKDPNLVFFKDDYGWTPLH